MIEMYAITLSRLNKWSLQCFRILGHPELDSGSETTLRFRVQCMKTAPEQDTETFSGQDDYIIRFKY